MRRPRPLTILVCVALSGCVTLSGCSGDGGRAEANRLFSEAQAARGEGDHVRAVGLLTKSLETRPTGSAYFERAKAHAALGDDAAAQADIDRASAAGLDRRNCQWLIDEMEKPVEQRFKLPLRPRPAVK